MKIFNINKSGIIQIVMILSMVILSIVVIMADFPEEVNDILWRLVRTALFASFGYSVLNIIRTIGSKKNENLGNDTADVNYEHKNESTKNGMILSTSIKRKELFYNPKEFRQILELTAILRVISFEKIQKQLSENNMRQGFCCLFYGPPGTGKTETSYQIARETGRDIMAVDISRIQSKYIGDSAKNIREIFGRYRSIAKESKESPILLLNEADAIISKRTIIGFNPVAEKDDNAMQNVILQEMEDFDGILITTTNLTENFDKAFDRRFLYKIYFSIPETNARTNIWQSTIPSLTEQEAKELAIKYKFSGGQIENIARKRVVESVLSGDNPSIERMKCYCQEEILSTGNDKKIGFTA
jgi:SpoVK/Ycf46/Vps4 family AAA+-type ATPase